MRCMVCMCGVNGANRVYDVHVCMYVCMCMHVHVSTGVCTCNVCCVHGYTCVCARVCACVCACVTLNSIHILSAESGAIGCSKTIHPPEHRIQERRWSRKKRNKSN